MSTPVRAAERVVGGIAIELVCRRCGEVFVPSPEAIRAGPAVARCCPTCRPPAEQDPEVSP